jgi:hypothetical protein
MLRESVGAGADSRSRTIGISKRQVFPAFSPFVKQRIRQSERPTDDPIVASGSAFAMSLRLTAPTVASYVTNGMHGRLFKVAPNATQLAAQPAMQLADSGLNRPAVRTPSFAPESPDDSEA